MNKYEMMFIVKATMESDQVKATAENMKKVVSECGGNVTEYKELGEKKLAYAIKKELNGYYFVMQFVKFVPSISPLLEATRVLDAVSKVSIVVSSMVVLAFCPVL